MSQIIHNISSPDDGLGDELRNAFNHQNEMNTELYNDKVDKETGKELSTNDFTDALKTKLLNIDNNAEVNIQSDWAQNDNTADDFIKNKPTIDNYVNTIGFFDYSNSNTTPLTLVANTEKKLTNDCIGAYTNIDHPTHGVTRLFDPTTNNIVLDELGVGDLVKLRVDINITTGTSNQVYRCILRLGIGTSQQFDIIIHEEQIKDTGSHQRTIFTGFYVGSEEVRLALGELVLVSDHSGSVVVNGFLFEAIKRNVNFVEISGVGVQSVTGDTVDNSDPQNPIINIPTLQEVADNGNEVISSDGLSKVIFGIGSLEYYFRTTISDTFIKVSEFNQGGLYFNIFNQFGTDIQVEFDSFVGLRIYNSTNEILITPTSATKNGIEFATINDIPTIPSNIEFTTNKSDSYTDSSSTTYASTKALVDGLGIKQNTLTNTTFGTFINSFMSKLTPVDSDIIPISDSANSFVGKKLNFSNLKIFLRSYFNSIYITNVIDSLGYTPENSANKGAINGYAGLDSSGKVPSSQLPSFVDDVLEYANLASLPTTGESGKIYITLDTNLEYRWSGTTYVNIAKGDVQSVNTKTGAVVLNTDDISESGTPTNKWFTNARAISSTLTSFVSGAGTISSSDSILSAIQKIVGNIALKQDALMSAYSMRANNTNATANATEIGFRQIGKSVYSGAITWTGTTAPFGATNHTYNWEKIGNITFFSVSLIFASQGTLLTAVQIEMPSDMPTPIKPDGLTAVSNVLYEAVGKIGASESNVSTGAVEAVLRSNSTNTGFEFYIAQIATNAKVARISGHYFTA